jgi:diguanylate cyclase (GGDEF)-like protein
MPLQWSRFRPWLALAAVAFFVFFQPALAFAQEPYFASRIEQTESLRTIDHPRFLRLLEELHHQTSGMSDHERWQLRYLDAWQASFHGDYANADPMLRDVIDHSGDSALVAKASAVLMGDMGSNKRYEEAFELANRSVANLPQTQDTLARFMVLSYVAQLIRSAGQYDLAEKYVREMAQTRPPGVTPCQPMALLLTVLYSSHKLTSSSAELQRGIDACQAAGEPVFSEAIWLVKGSLYLDEDQPEKAIALLHRIAPGIRANQYYSHMLASQVELAQAYWERGDDAEARKAALAALASSDPGDISESLRDAYQVLYRIEKKHGNAAAALSYYEHYVAQDKGYLDDLSARALAYQVVQQQILARKLETEELNKQNSVLKLQRALDAKAAETSRLYITLLIILLAAIAFWLFRTMRSQRRFKHMATRDGLTGILNHQHFVSEADRALRLLEKKLGHACLISIDLDHFKQINDTHGHAMGDAVLRRAVAVCQQQLRPADLFGRLGGEEFGILLHDCLRAQGMDIANRVRMAIGATPLEKDGGVVPVSASVGLASTDTSGYGLQRLCMEADAALYRAKRAGRNRVVADTEGGSLVEA